MATLNYEPLDVIPPSSWRWIRSAAAVTVFDLICGFYVARHIVINGSWGGIYGFNGWARPVIFVTSLFNVGAFFLVVGVLLLNKNRHRWWLCFGFAVHFFIALIFVDLRYGLPLYVG